MARYFLAFPIPKTIAETLIAIQPKNLAGIRKLDAKELHLTLHFLGELQDSEVIDVIQNLAFLRCMKVETNIQGVGQFPEDGEPRVLWVGVEKTESLMALHQTITNTLKKYIRFEPPGWDYCPHISLAHVEDKSISDFSSWLTNHRNLRYESIIFRKYFLFASDWVDKKPQYREVAQFQLYDTKK